MWWGISMIEENTYFKWSRKTSLRRSILSSNRKVRNEPARQGMIPCGMWKTSYVGKLDWESWSRQWKMRVPENIPCKLCHSVVQRQMLVSLHRIICASQGLTVGHLLPWPDSHRMWKPLSITEADSKVPRAFLTERSWDWLSFLSWFQKSDCCCCF